METLFLELEREWEGETEERVDIVEAVAGGEGYGFWIWF